MVQSAVGRASSNYPFYPLLWATAGDAIASIKFSSSNKGLLNTKPPQQSPRMPQKFCEREELFVENTEV